MILPHYSVPLQIGALACFILSIVHIFMIPVFARLYRNYQNKRIAFPEDWKRFLWLGEWYRLMSTIELVFLLWSVPLFFWFLYTEGYKGTMAYLNTRNYTFSMFIIVMWLLLGSKPISYAVEHAFAKIANIGRQSPKSWWLTVMFVAPLSTIFLRETGAIIIATTLLAKYFYDLSPSTRFSYATMGLLFSNVSIGGLLTTSSSRSLSMILRTLRWDNYEVMTHFGWKALLAICLSTTVYYYLFRREFHHFPRKIEHIINAGRKIPIWIICVHIAMAFAAMRFRSAPVLMGGVCIFYVFFHRLTVFYQNKIDFWKVCCLGVFFIGMSFVGGLQEWWILKLVKNSSDFGYMWAAYILSIFLDNVLVNLMMHDLPVVTDCYLYLVVAGCMSAGGLTLIANTPNIVSFATLRPFFQKPSFSFWKLFLASLFPSVLALMLFWLLRGLPEINICVFR